jgi:hypothetical protein
MGTKAELLKLMTYLAENDREVYRQLRAEAWALIAAKHSQKTPEQIAAWKQQAS